jgi:large subunit ribosomal protein L22
MGARKRNTADRRKEETRNRYQAILRNCPTSPRKMRLVTDLISGMDVNRALDVLKFSSQEASR